MGFSICLFLKGRIVLVFDDMDFQRKQLKINQIYKGLSSIKIIWWKKMIPIFLGIIVVTILNMHSPYPAFFSIRDILFGLFIGILVFIVNFFISYFKRRIRKIRYALNNTNKRLTPDTLDAIYPFFLRIVIIVLMACIEEYVFRSYFLFFTNAYFSIVISILVNAIFFYIIHFNSKIIELLFMGAMFAIITLITKNILTAIVAHSVNNTLVYIARRTHLIQKLIKNN